MHWLAEVPMAVVAAHLEMLPRLEAEESQTAVTIAAIGRLGFQAGAWVRRQWSAWQRAGRGGGRDRAHRATPQDLATAGIGRRVVVKRG
jgi:hypothetical protein